MPQVIAIPTTKRPVPLAVYADAELIRLAIQARQQQHRYLELTASYDNWFQIPESAGREIDVVLGRIHELAEQIAGLPATSTAGMQLKAQVLLAFHKHDQRVRPTWDPAAALAQSLARDVAGDDGPPPRAVA